MEGQAKRYFFLVISVFVLYHDMCSLAITLHEERSFVNPRSISPNAPSNSQGSSADKRSNGRSLQQDERLQMKTFIDKIAKGAYTNEKGFEKILVESEKQSNSKFLETLRLEGYNLTNEREICADWQDFDGTTCVCSNQCRCNSNVYMGKVCDSNGNTYPYMCEFSYKMCSRQIPSTSTLKSCGVCKKMKMTGSHIYPEHCSEGLGIFDIDPTGNTWTSTDSLGNQIKLFHSHEAKTWVVGRSSIEKLDKVGYFNETPINKSLRIVGSTDLKQAGIVFKANTPHPQDSREGATVYFNETYGQFDPFLHLECMPDNIVSIGKRDTSPASREKRWVLSEIKNSLRPEVEALKKKFVSLIGEPLGFKILVHDIFNRLLDLKERMIDLRKLESEFGELTKTVGPDLNYLAPEFSNDFDTSFHDKWMKALAKQATWSLVGLMYVQMPLEIASLVASTAGKAAMAFAAVGAFISVAAAITSIVVSWQTEKFQRDHLRKVKRNLIDARQQLKTALGHTQAFQVKFYKTVIYPLKKFTNHMRTYDSHFQKFYDFLISTFGSTMSPDVGAKVYGKVNSHSLKTMKEKHLIPLIHFLSFKLEDLKQKIESYKQTEKLITLIRNNINEQRYPKEIFSLIKSIDKKITKKIVPTEFSLLKFIADKVLSNKECYWGYKLNGIRKGSVTKSNYKSAPLCLSPELSAIETSFQKLTGRNMSPHRIVSRIQHQRFTNKYQKLKFLADFILPAKPCYWGYDLALIRNNKLSISDIVNANPSKAAFTSIKPLPDNLKANALCSAVKICNPNWQRYVKCLLKMYDGGNLCKGAVNC